MTAACLHRHVTVYGACWCKPEAHRHVRCNDCGAYFAESTGGRP